MFTCFVRELQFYSIKQIFYLNMFHKFSIYKIKRPIDEYMGVRI